MAASPSMQYHNEISPFLIKESNRPGKTVDKNESNKINTTSFVTIHQVSTEIMNMRSQSKKGKKNQNMYKDDVLRRDRDGISSIKFQTHPVGMHGTRLCLLLVITGSKSRMTPVRASLKKNATRMKHVESENEWDPCRSPNADTK